MQLCLHNILQVFYYSAMAAELFIEKRTEISIINVSCLKDDVWNFFYLNLFFFNGTERRHKVGRHFIA